MLAEGTRGCEQLALLGAPRAAGRPWSSAFPYHPHVTVAHHLDDVLLDRAFHRAPPTFECDFEGRLTSRSTSTRAENGLGPRRGTSR